MRAVAIVLLLLPLFGGCALFPNWSPQGALSGRPYGEVEVPKVWDAAKDAFSVDWRTAFVEDADYQIGSDWDIQLQPMYRKGMRKKCTVWLHRDPKGHPYVEVQILREVNTDRYHPMDLAKAEWEADGRDLDMERRILSAVDLRVGRMQGSPGSAGSRPSPYREEETEAEKQKRLWGGDDQ